MELDAKKLIYRTLWVATGVLSATVFVGLIELLLINTGTAVDWVILMYFMAILVLGLFVGLVCGRIAWQKIYVEGVRGMKYTMEHSVRAKAFEDKLYKDLKDFDIDKAMKWTVTIFLVFVMLIISACIAFHIVRYAKTHLENEGVTIIKSL